MGQLLYEELPLFFCTILCPLQILPHLKPNWGYQYFICNAGNKRFCHRTAIRRQISAVCVVRTGFLLNLFIYIVGA